MTRTGYTAVCKIEYAHSHPDGYSYLAYTLLGTLTLVHLHGDESRHRQAGPFILQLLVMVYGTPIVRPPRYSVTIWRLDSLSRLALDVQFSTYVLLYVIYI